MDKDTNIEIYINANEPTMLGTILWSLKFKIDSAYYSCIFTIKVPWKYAFEDWVDFFDNKTDELYFPEVVLSNNSDHIITDLLTTKTGSRVINQIPNNLILLKLRRCIYEAKNKEYHFFKIYSRKNL